jgi:2'-5' RNA ligase
MWTGAMGHAVELLFEPAAEAEIKDVWARLEAAGVPSLASRTHRRHRPHISLTVAERIDTDQLQGASDSLSATHLDVTLYAPAVFPRPGVLYLSVIPTLPLLRVHEEVQAALTDSMLAPRDGYSVGGWMPHCTLAQDLTRAELLRGIDLLYDQPPITAHVDSGGLLNTSTGEVLRLGTLQPHH